MTAEGHSSVAVAQRKPLWKRIVGAQEFGLAVVILIMMAALTAFTPMIGRPVSETVPEGAAVEQQGEMIVVTGPDGASRRYDTADGWRVIDRFGRKRLELKERIAIPPDAKVEDLKERIPLAAGEEIEDLPDYSGRRIVRGGVEVRVLPGPGWQVVEGERGERAVERALGYRVAGEGGTREYRFDDGWQLTQPDGEGGGRSIERDYRVNKFLNKNNLVSNATAASFIAIMAVGVMGIIVMGGIDLSVGSIYALAAVFGAFALRWLQAEGDSEPVPGIVSIPLGLAVCCAVGALCGAINGAATVGLKVHPFIITLGGLAVYRGLAFVFTGGQSISNFPPSFTTEGFRAEVWGVSPIPLLVMVVIGLIGAFVFAKTVFGRRVYAIGGNETAARYAGVPVGLTKIKMFTIGGLLAGLAAAVLLGYYGAADSSVGTAYELKVIAAAVVGGASLSGGRGTAIGAVLGAIVIQIIDNAIVVLGVDSNYTNIVIGLAIVLAVVVDQAKHRFTSGAR